MNHKEAVKISKALGDATRMRIYEGISECGEMFCGQIVERYGVTPGTISHHLKILGDANLIELRREGQFIYSRAVPRTIRDYGVWLNRMSGKKKATGKARQPSR